jgi:23S rRNA (cytosine1962-C5)-methyltransferase
MQTLILSKEGSLKLKKLDHSLFSKDFKDLPKSLRPGEWCYFVNEKSHEKYLGFVNLFSESNWPIAFMVDEVKQEKLQVEEIIKSKIEQAIQFRKIFKRLKSGSRLFYGENDGLPGLVIDEYHKVILIQINTAGVDCYREYIKGLVQTFFPSKKLYFYDNQAYRANEKLPQYPVEKIEEDLEIEENNLNYRISKEVIQKIGYYYDHRDNRKKASDLIMSFDKEFTSGLDLFSYVGSWGMHLLSAGVKHVDFVDQGNFQEEIKVNCQLNHFDNRFEFYRQDVFKFLDQSIEQNKQYDVICSDPPAFSKSSHQKQNAIEGYIKLHTKLLKLIAPQGILLIGSCTHHLNHEELDQTVCEASLRQKRRVRLIDIGIQGPDHVISSLKDKSFYIKYLAYIVEN